MNSQRNVICLPGGNSRHLQVGNLFAAGSRQSEVSSQQSGYINKWPFAYGLSRDCSLNFSQLNLVFCGPFATAIRLQTTDTINLSRKSFRKLTDCPHNRYWGIWIWIWGSWAPEKGASAGGKSRVASTGKANAIIHSYHRRSRLAFNMFVDIQLERFPSSLTIAASADGPRGGFEYIVLFKGWSLPKRIEMEMRIIKINIFEFIEI